MSQLTQTTQMKSDYPKAAAVLGLVGGVLIMLTGVLLMGASAFILPHMNFANLATPAGLSPGAVPALVSGIVGAIGLFGLVSGVIVLASSVLLLANIGKQRTWGVLILVFSILSFLGLGGFVVGAILGIIGGILTLRWKPVQ